MSIQKILFEKLDDRSFRNQNKYVCRESDLNVFIWSTNMMYKISRLWPDNFITICVWNLVLFSGSNTIIVNS